MIFTLEKHMTPIVAQWFLDAGFLVRKEIMLPHGYVDLIAYCPESRVLVSVELKLSKVLDVFRQAVRNKEYVSASFVALPYDVAARIWVNASRRSRFIEENIGVLAVYSNRCDIALDAQISKTITDCFGRIEKRFLRYGNNLPPLTLDR
jgi:hypothetical protein